MTCIFPTADKFLIFFQIFCIFFYITVIFPMIRYRKIFYDLHFFYKAAVQLAFMDLFGIIFTIFYVTCNISNQFCLPRITRWIPYFMTEVMLLIIAFNRFCAVVLFKYYQTIFNSKLVNWFFLIPIILSVHCFPLYTCVVQDQSCWYYKWFFVINFIFTIFIMVSLVLLYVIAYFYQRCFNSMNQLNENRFLYQAAISSGFLIAVYLFWLCTNYFDPLIDVIYTYLITAHFTISPVVYLCFNKKLRRYVLHSISFGRIPVENIINPVIINVGSSNPNSIPP